MHCQYLCLLEPPYPKLFDLAQALETASKDLLDIQPSQAQPLVGDVSIHQVQDKKQGTTCYRCGGQHPPTGCRFKDYQCHYCGKTGHLQKVCHKKKNGHRKTQQQRSQKGPKHLLLYQMIVSQKQSFSLCTE